MIKTEWAVSHYELFSFYFCWGVRSQYMESSTLSWTFLGVAGVLVTAGISTTLLTSWAPLIYVGGVLFFFGLVCISEALWGPFD
jgi:hypothetical protein